MILTVNGNRAVLHARLVPALMRVMPRIEGQRAWLKAGGLSLAATGHNIELLREAFPGLVVNSDATTENPDVSDDFDPARYPTSYAEKSSSYAHQAKAKLKARTKPNFALFMEQGTGKTKVAIDLVGEDFCARRITGVLVVAPKGVHRQWAESQIPMHSGVEAVSAFWPFKELPQSLLPGAELKFMCINIDAVRTAKGFQACCEFLAAHSNKVRIILDEAHRIKNKSSASWKKMSQLGQRVRQRMVLTGTPIAKELTDEWAILQWLDPQILGINFISTFRNEYCLMGGWEGKVVVGYRNVDRFKHKVEPYTFRATKDEIGILPKAYERWSFDLTKEQKRKIKELKDQLFTQLANGEILTPNGVLPALLIMQQISNGFVQEGKSVRSLFDKPLDNPRLAAAQDWVMANEGKLVIWARFQEDIRQLYQLLSNQAVTYYGETKPKEREQAVAQFLDPSSSVRIFISTPSAGGTGLNLQGGCNSVLYYSNSENSIERWQSEDRVHRIGTNGIVTYTDFVAPGSLDSKILRNLLNKKMTSEMALSEIKDWLSEEE